MECPKCSGGSYLVEEDLVKVLESPDPIKILIKATYQCRACSDRFTRLFYDLLESRRRPDVQYDQQPQYQQSTQYQQQAKQEDAAAEGLKFF